MDCLEFKCLVDYFDLGVVVQIVLSSGVLAWIQVL